MSYFNIYFRTIIILGFLTFFPMKLITMEKVESQEANEAVLWHEDWNEEWEGQKKWFNDLSDDQKKYFIKERASDLHTNDKKWKDGIEIINIAKQKIKARMKIEEISKIIDPKNEKHKDFIIDPKNEKHKDFIIEKLMKSLIKREFEN